MEFLQANIPWIFSGVGIPVAVGLWWLLKKRFGRPAVPSAGNHITLAQPARAKPAATVPPASVTLPDVLSPQHMIKTVSAAPPLAREYVKQQFIGIPIDWTLAFSDARKILNGPLATVYFSLPDTSCEVRCEASVETYPFLRVALVGEQVGIRGIVDDVSSVEVFLREVLLTR